MKHVSPVGIQSAHQWYLVCLNTGVTAVVTLEDLTNLIQAERVFSAVRVTAEMGREFEEGRARAGYMSATCRLKSGESDRVG
jgi:hypothetical protein